MPASVAWLDAHSTGDQEVAGSIPTRSCAILPWRLIMNIFYGHSLPSADSRRALLASGKRMYTSTG